MTRHASCHRDCDTFCAPCLLLLCLVAIWFIYFTEYTHQRGTGGNQLRESAEQMLVAHLLNEKSREQLVKRRVSRYMVPGAVDEEVARWLAESGGAGAAALGERGG